MQGKEFLGVYSSVQQRSKDVSKRFFFVWSNEERFDVQKLDASMKPVDILKTIDAQTFHTLFAHEPDIIITPASEGVKQAAQQKPLGSMGPAEVEHVLREHFRKASLRIKRPAEKAAALQAIQTLAEVEEGITPEHRHMFTDFGIDLRKKKELALALVFCKRVLNLSPEDDHAYFNTARVLLDMGNFDDAEQHVLTALYITPNSRIYQKMLRHLQMLRLQHS